MGVYYLYTILQLFLIIFRVGRERPVNYGLCVKLDNKSANLIISQHQIANLF